MFWDFIFKIIFSRKINKITTADPKFQQIKGYANELKKIKQERSDAVKELIEIHDKKEKIDAIIDSPEFQKSLAEGSPEVREIFRKLKNL